MRRVAFSGDTASGAEIWFWYDNSRRALARYEHFLATAIASGQAIPDEFIGLTRDELQERFLGFGQELQFAASLAMVSAVEAAIRTDYAQRVYQRRKDDLSRSMRNLYRGKGLRVSLSDDLLDLWLQHYPESKNAVGEFRGAIKFRDWLAHGRWWLPKLGRNYLPDDIFDIADRLFQELPSIERW